MNTETKNLILFVILSCLIVFGYDRFFAAKPTETSIVAKQKIQNGDNSSNSQNIVIAEPEIQEEPIDIEIKSDNLKGVISTKGLVLKDISLLKYFDDVKYQNNVKVLWKNKDSKYTTFTGWKTDGNIRMPTKKTVWHLEGDNKVLSPGNNVTFSYDNGQGIVFQKTYSIDNDYVINITQSVTNKSAAPVSIKPFARITRSIGEKSDTWSAAYEGPIGVFNGKSEEVEYKDIDKKKDITMSSVGGWTGITDKYWLVAFIPSQDNSVSNRFRKIGNEYIIDVYSEDVVLDAGMSTSSTHNLFLGAKDINILDMYEKKFNVKNFDLAIDFGYLYFLTKPLLYLLAFVHDYIGNLGVGILLLTVLLKLLLFPLANKSYRSMNKMREIQPKVQAIQAMYANDKMQMGQALSSLYKREKVNPAGGCLPMLLQMPILFALYKVLYISIEMRQAPFFGWIHDLSAPDSMYILNLFGLIPVDLPGFLQIGIWPIIMGLSMLVQQKLSPQVGDQAQAKMMMIVMPVMFTWMFAGFPSGLVIYYTWSNILGIIQQYAIQKIDERSKVR